MVIFLLTLISALGIMIVNQIGNQLKSTTNRAIALLVVP